MEGQTLVVVPEGGHKATPLERVSPSETLDNQEKICLLD